MLIDKTYMPLQCDLDEVMITYFGKMTLTADQRKTLQLMFFAGAACAFNVLMNKPEQHDTLREELTDHADRLEREGL